MVSSYLMDKELFRHNERYPLRNASANLTVDQYNLMREGTKQKGHNRYSSYFQVQKAKEKCYPENKTVHETDAKTSGLYV
jgi:hypothetical protein